MHPSLSFEQAPPISVPYRFFLTAPWFGVLAGLLLVWQGGEMFTSRWMPATLAATHLMVVGYMLQAMCGAMLQFVPVAAGGNIWRPQLVAGITHPLIAMAALLLASAFVTQISPLFAAAAHTFILGLGVLVAVTMTGLWRTSAQGATIVTLRISLLGLVITVGLGVTLALGLAYGSRWSLPVMTDVHAAWGLGGWGLMLLAGVSYFVVPMFQLTPPYPVWFARGFPLLIVALLLLWSLQLLGLDESLRQAVFLGGVGVAGTFALQTLHLQSRRRRKVPDITLTFFRLAMLALLLLLLSAVAYVAVPAVAADPRAAVWMGVLAIVGVFVSAINGMLYKIVPFLNWLHLQRITVKGSPPPTMKQMIADKAMHRQYSVHLAALGMLLLAVWWPALVRPAGLLFAVSSAWLGVNLLLAVRVYRRFKDRIHASA